jgi:predicted SAM-dependent methyltransferase
MAAQNRVKKTLYKFFPFMPKTNLAIGRKLYATKVKLNEKNVIKALSNKKDVYANIGCGGSGLAEGWVNIDYIKYENVTSCFDCSKNLPFADSTVKGIFCEHFFEHLDYKNEVPYFLQSCFRSLEKNGVLRIIVPDAEKYLLGYCAAGWDMLKKTRPLDDDLTDVLMGIRYQTKMQLINEVFRQDGEHKYAWDFETMKLALNNAGFTVVEKMDYLKSHDPVLAIDMLVRKPESLYVEAVK